MDYKKAYIDFLKTYIHTTRPLRVVFDASNGPAGMLVKDLFKDTSVEAIVIHDDIDPDFRAHGPNPLLPGASDSCARAIIEHKADMGVMFDADADRAMFLDNKGVMLPACFIAPLLFKGSKPPYVVDELVYQSVSMLHTVPEKDLIPSRIGASFLKEAMRKEGATCGAEYSGHYYFKDFFNLDSGIFAAIMVINAYDGFKNDSGHTIVTKEIRTAGKNMAEIYANLEKKYTPLAVRVDKRDGLTFVFDTYWINTRSSNTEPIMRIIAGGDGAMNDRVLEIEHDI